MRVGRFRPLLRRHWLAIATAAGCVVAGTASAADLTVAADLLHPKPGAVVENAAGDPPAAVVRSIDGQILGYAFSSRQVSGSVGYSGRPLDIVAAVTPEGVVAGARIVAHEEPILVIGIPREALAAYVANFRGFNVLAGLGPTAIAGRAQAPQGVAGASVTSAVIRDAIVRSGRAVLRARREAADAASRPRLDRDGLRQSSWPGLVEEGSVRRLLVSRGEAAGLLGTRDDEPDKTFIELWLGLATPATVGVSLLGQRIYEKELAGIGPDDDLIFVAGRGLYSFRGTDWRRSGVFDRIEIVQAGRTIRLRASDHERIDVLQAPGAPEFRELALFRIAQATGFDATAPFRLDLTLRPSTAPPGPAAPAVVSLPYQIPEAYLIRPAAAPAASVPDAVLADTPAAREPLWQDFWWQRRYEIAAVGLMLGVLGVILIFQDWVTVRGTVYRRIRVGYLLLTFLFLGLVANAQLSVVNVITFVHALLSGFHWELFLLDPVVFVLWSFVAVSILFWGRGVFCGWLCPFGALQELLNTLARRFGVTQVAIPFGLHERLWMIKYVIFIGIFAISLHSILAAFTAAEIEPFKTVITLKFVRDWPLVAYAAAILVVGLFIERFFCRYLCPLGAALAIPARIRMFDWLRRYRECGSECHVCARTCTVQAIHPFGQVNPNECIHCLKCQANYRDAAVCLHIKKRVERRRPRPPIPSLGVPLPEGKAAE